MVLLLALSCLPFAGCLNGNQSSSLRGPTVARPAPAGEPRSVKLAFSALPPARTSEAYNATFATAGQYADAILIQRAPPWADFLPGGRVSRTTSDSTRLETALVKQYGLSLFFAIDPTDGVVQRTRIANLPASVDPQTGFRDPDLRNAFLAYTTYVVKNYKPEYLAIGVEVNMLYERVPDQFEAFVSLYREAYDVAKAANTKTKVFPTFQLEDLQGTFGVVRPPHWDVLDRFRGRMDTLAVSTYPYLADMRTAAELRVEYFSQLRQHWDGEILIAETANPSAPVEGHAVVGTEEDQLAYLARVLGDAEANRFSMVVWLAALDPAVSQGAGSSLRAIGLRKGDGANKLAWTLWEDWARRPLTAPRK